MLNHEQRITVHTYVTIIGIRFMIIFHKFVLRHLRIRRHTVLSAGQAKRPTTALAQAMTQARIHGSVLIGQALVRQQCGGFTGGSDGVRSVTGRREMAGTGK